MIVIIDYDAGNTRSVMNALRRLGADFVLTNDNNTISQADRIILPGVGHAKPAMEKLRKLNLLDEIKSTQKPFLGVCLGMQLLYESSEEGETISLGLIPGRVTKFQQKDDMRIPHMGWNTNIYQHTDPLIMEGVDTTETYYVHSYYAPVNEYAIAICHYYYDFTAYVRKDNFHGLQFHPEKSGPIGEKILQNFLSL